MIVNLTEKELINAQGLATIGAGRRISGCRPAYKTD